MSISSVSSSDPSTLFQDTVQNQLAQQMLALQTSLQNGNISAAQTVFANLAQSLPQATTQASQATLGSQSATSNQTSQAFQALGTALRNGNVADAQSAFTLLKSALNSGHHRGGQRGGKTSSASSTTEDKSTTASASDTGTSYILDAWA